MQEDKHTITYNLELLKWYLDDEQINTEHTFANLSLAYAEDQLCFIRIFMYVSNTRTTERDEMVYKILIHFLCVIASDLVMLNIDLFLKVSNNKEDIIFYLQCPVISERILKYINHLAKVDDDFKNIKDFNLSNKKEKSDIEYTYETTSDLLICILDEPKFNGIQY